MISNMITWLQDALSEAHATADLQAVQALERHGANSKLQSDVQEKARSKEALLRQLQMLELAKSTNAA